MKASGLRGCIRFDGARVTMRKGVLGRPWQRRTIAFPLRAIRGVMVGSNRFGLGEIRFVVAGARTDRPSRRLGTRPRRRDRAALTFPPWRARQFALLARAVQAALEKLPVADELATGPQRFHCDPPRGQR